MKSFMKAKKTLTETSKEVNWLNSKANFVNLLHPAIEIIKHLKSG